MCISMMAREIFFTDYHQKTPMTVLVTVVEDCVDDCVDGCVDVCDTTEHGSPQIARGCLNFVAA